MTSEEAHTLLIWQKIKAIVGDFELVNLLGYAEQIFDLNSDKYNIPFRMSDRGIEFRNAFVYEENIEKNLVDNKSVLDLLNSIPLCHMINLLEKYIILREEHLYDSENN